MEPKARLDPVYQDLVTRLELSTRKLRESVARLRDYHSSNPKLPIDETTHEKWQSAILGNEAQKTLEDLICSANHLLRYGFEVAPYGS